MNLLLLAAVIVSSPISMIGVLVVLSLVCFIFALIPNFCPPVPWGYIATYVLFLAMVLLLWGYGRGIA